MTTLALASSQWAYSGHQVDWEELPSANQSSTRINNIPTAGVIPSRQRLTYKGRLIKDTTNLSELQLKHGTVIFLVGSNELLEEPLERPRFVEEMSETERQEELARFMDLRERLDDEDRRTAEHFISSFPDMPDFIPYDFTYRAGQITDGRRFIHDLTKRNMEALHINSQAQQLCSACLANNTELAKRLAIGHYSPSSSPLALALSGLLHMRENPLLMAIQQGNLELVRYFIKDGGALINSQSARTGSHRALFVAVQTNREDMVELLVSEGARVDIRDAGGRTPLFLACQIGNIDVVRFLLNQVRGRVDALFTKNERYDWVVSAINRDHVEIVALLMNYKYMRCDYVDPIDHLTPLHKAAKKGSVRVANYLIVEQFMDVNVVAKGKFTPLSLAIGQGGIE
eukprot:Ihof_evm4s65 gene=Ihof_evmTU4s65